MVFERQQRWGRPGKREGGDVGVGGEGKIESHLAAGPGAGLGVAGAWIFQAVGVIDSQGHLHTARGCP